VEELRTISIVIPVFCRTHYLKQLLEYFQAQGLTCPIIVADSSFSPEREVNLMTVNAVRGELNVQYHSCEGITLCSAIAEALKVADTKYSIVCSDDDFVLPEALRKCVNFLDSNPDYVGARGWDMLLYTYEMTKPHSIRWRTLEPSTPRAKVWAIRQTMPTFYSNDPSARFTEGAFTEDRAFWAVYRRHDHLRNMELTAKATTDFFFVDHLSFCLPLVQGKLKSLDTLHMVRRYQSQNIYDHNVDPAVKPFDELLVSDDFSEKYSRFRNCIGQELSNATKISFENSGKLVDRAFLRYLSFYLNHHLARSQERKHRVTKIDTLVKAMRVAWTALSCAVLDRRFGDLLKSPYEFALTSSTLRKRSFQLDVFLKRFSCSREFELIYGFLLT
jgi:glycosyltransferase domain-containing protein